MIVNVFPEISKVIPVPAAKPITPVSPRRLSTPDVIPETAVADIIKVLPLVVRVIPVPAEKPTVPVSPFIEFIILGALIPLGKFKRP